MAVVRLRDRYRELLRAEIAETVAFPAEIDDEIAIRVPPEHCHLFEAGNGARIGD